MAISLYDLSVASFLQTLGAVDGFLAKGLAHFKEKNLDANSLVEVRLFEDMLPLHFQIVSIAHHSRGAIDGVKAGLAGPPAQMPSASYADLQKIVADARTALEKVTPAEVNALEGKDMVFQIGDRKLPFSAENYLLSFALPNFYFHSATAYDILRTKGVPLGKRDFMGRMRMKAA